MTPQRDGELPWAFSDARTSFLCLLFGVLLLGWAWWDVSGTGDLNDQTGGLVLGIFSLMILLVGAGSWLWSGRQAIDRRRREIFDVLEGRNAPGPSPATSESFVFVAGSARHHREDCLLVQRKDVTRVLAGSPALDDHRPCEMCQP